MRYTSVEGFVMEQLVESHEESQQSARLYLRIDPEKHEDLVRLAERLGQAKSTLATGLLQAAIDQAVFTLDNLPKAENVTVGADGSVEVAS